MFAASVEDLGQLLPSFVASMALTSPAVNSPAKRPCGSAGASPGPPEVLRRRLDKSCGFFGTHHLSLLSMYPAAAMSGDDGWPWA
jgi:hypothetical protein